MKREPTLLYIFRLLVGFGLFVFMMMLYWSSELIESNLKEIRAETEQMRRDLQSQHTDIMEAIRQHQITPTNAAKQQTNNRPHMDPSFPNLLIKDPFYEKTLPELLGPLFKPLGTFITDVVGKPENLHPFSNWGQVLMWNGLCTVSVARQLFGKYETLSPNMAIKMEERKNVKTGRMEFWIHLRDGVFWQPLQQKWFAEGIKLAPHFLHKHPVTAHDYKFYWDAFMNKFVQESGAVVLRTVYDDIEEIEVVDDLTFIVRWKAQKVEEPDGQTAYRIKYVAKSQTGALQPLPCFVYKYFVDGTKIVEDDNATDTYRINSVWAQNFNQHWAKNIIVSCGAWIFDGFTDRQIEFQRNRDHFFPYDSLTEAKEFPIKNTLDAMWEDFKANKTDTYNLTPEQLLGYQEFLKSKHYQEQVKNNNAIKRLDYVARIYAYIGWNAAKVYFKNRKVRQALTMAIDRQRIIRQNLNGMGIEITGTFYRFSPAYDESIQPWPYDPLRARRQLEEEGWYESKGDGILYKEIDGKQVPFVFSLTYYVKNATQKSICEYVSTALKEIGIVCNLNGVDIADLSAVFDSKNFDALCLNWGLGTPPEDPRQLWHSSGAKEKGSSNAIGFANAEIDKIIDALSYESDPGKRIELYHRFNAIIHEEAPYTFLYTPKSALLYREYVENVFLPKDRQDLVPGANVGEPDSSVYWLKKH